MVDFSVGWIFSTFVGALLAFVALIIADKVIAHQIDAKRLFILSVIALFVTPVVASFALGFVAGAGPIAVYLIPLLVWILLGEVLLTAERMTKLKVAAVGFFVYLIISQVIGPYIPF